MTLQEQVLTNASSRQDISTMPTLRRTRIREPVKPNFECYENYSGSLMNMTEKGFIVIVTPF